MPVAIQEPDVEYCKAMHIINREFSREMISRLSAVGNKAVETPDTAVECHNMRFGYSGIVIVIKVVCKRLAKIPASGKKLNSVSVRVSMGVAFLANFFIGGFEDGNWFLRLIQDEVRAPGTVRVQR